jgi:thioredoxin reductase/SAM-dependent methyltransferase
MDDAAYDVLVIGGGAAGLAGALALGRSRRSVLVVDTGEPRNAPAGHVHNYLGREGTPPGELLTIGRREVEQYGVRVERGTVETAERRQGLFVARLSDAREVTARRLLVATGLTDQLPDLPGLAEGWGSTVLHCPYCHGWEVRDQPVGILGTGPMALHQTLMFRQLTPDVTLFAHDAPPPTGEEREQLRALGVRVVADRVTAWEGNGVRLQSGELVPRQVLVVSPRFVARSAVLESLAVHAEPVEVNGAVVGYGVPADPTGRTSAEGVWVAGNVANVMAQVIGSAAAGLAAGAAINGDLVAEDARLAVERHRLTSEEGWDERYRSHPTAIWSGNPNPGLLAAAAELPPGRALDVGCGEGADALWLAENGWQVDAADISSVALGRAAAHGRERNLEVNWMHADLLASPPEAGAYDLVNAQFLHLPRKERQELYAALAEAVRPGGTLLIVAHHPSDLATSVRRPHLPEMFFTPEELVAELDPARWQIVVADTRPRTATDGEGVTVTVHDTLLQARRTG